MVAPMTSYPASTSNAAATDESTPPDIATRTRSLTAPLPPIADWGFRIVDWKHGPRIRNPQFAIRNYRVSPVQHRRQGSHLLDNPWERRHHRVHVLSRAVLPERKAQRRHAELARDAHRAEDVRRLHGSGAAGRARRAGDEIGRAHV